MTTFPCLLLSHFCLIKQSVPKNALYRVCGYYGYEKTSDTSQEFCQEVKTGEDPNPTPAPTIDPIQTPDSSPAPEQPEQPNQPDHED